MGTLDFVDNIHKALDKGKYPLGVFLDLTNLNIINVLRGTPLLW